MKILHAQSGHNQSGVPLGPSGYVVCQVCGKEVQEISKETAQQYAFCFLHRPSHHTEVHMPAAPKPSQVEVKERSTVRGPRQRTGVVIKVKAKKTARISGSGHTPPKKGKCGAWLVEIKEQGGITKQAIVDGCIQHGLKATMHAAMASYCRQLKLLKD
jgi:hypothetical protein